MVEAEKLKAAGEAYKHDMMRARVTELEADLQSTRHAAKREASSRDPTAYLFLFHCACQGKGRVHILEQLLPRRPRDLREPCFKDLDACTGMSRALSEARNAISAREKEAHALKLELENLKAAKSRPENGTAAQANGDQARPRLSTVSVLSVRGKHRISLGFTGPPC